MTQASSLWEGQIVNNEFHLKKYLGGSDQSRVFLTEYSGQQAAIKLISADAGNLERQLQRLELAKKLSHPHLIRVFQTGRCRLDTTDLIFAVMEYAEENLAQIVPERRLTAEEARQMLDPALEALSFLHGQGYVHGRVKPANIMASGDKLKLSSD
ncbi:MAG TPA: protein kinase, partial [Candidatus Angelobacter sp.]|nr:protein kinase [Candidatus Angelobacter sp.]